MKDSRHAGVFLSEGFKACWESSLVKDSRHAESSLVKDSRHAESSLVKDSKHAESSLVKDSRNAGVKDSRHAGVFLSEGFKACWSLP